MFDSENSMMEPPIETLLDIVGSKFALVVLAADRARQISEYSNKLSGSSSGYLPAQITSMSGKPLTMALEEIFEGKVIPEIEQDAPEADDSESA
jgi:DNA-directed RNA polymerase subunit omega